MKESQNNLYTIAKNIELVAEHLLHIRETLLLHTATFSIICIAIKQMQESQNNQGTDVKSSEISQN